MPDSGKVVGIQALRALAASMVVIDHSLRKLVENGSLPHGFEVLADYLGLVGVATFFAVSGFVMALTAQHRRGSANALDFLRRRIVRIVPLYWLITVVHAIRLSISGKPPSWGDLASSLFFIPYFDAGGMLRPVLGVGWTLNFEMYFYLLFAIGLLLPARVGMDAVLMLLVGSVVVGGLMEEQTAMLAVVTSPLLLLFAAGMLAHRFIAPAFTEPMASRGAIPGLFVLLGDASFSLYLTHGFVLGGLAMALASRQLPALAAALFVLFSLLVSTVVGVAVHLWIDRPLHRLWQFGGKHSLSVREQVV